MYTFLGRRTPQRLARVALSIALGVGCGGDDTETAGSTGSGAAAASSSMSTASTSSSGTSGGDGGTGATGAAGPGGAGPGGQGGATSSAGGAGGAGGGGMCAPDPTTTCDACIAMCCSAEAAACTADPNCVCWRDCMVANNDVGMCFNECGAPGAAAMTYGTCGGDHCADPCEQF